MSGGWNTIESGMFAMPFMSFDVLGAALMID